jgi:hypothetical protein
VQVEKARPSPSGENQPRVFGDPTSSAALLGREMEGAGTWISFPRRPCRELSSRADEVIE